MTEALDRRQLHGALQSARNDLAALFACSPLGMVRLDADDRVVMWNPGAERMFGWAEDEVRGEPVPMLDAADLHPSRDPGSRPLAGEHLEGTRLTCRAKDGHPVEVQAWTLLMQAQENQADQADQSPQLVVLMADVTSQVQAEQALRGRERRWRTLVQNVSDTVTLVDADGTMTAASGEAKPILGYPVGAWVGRPVAELVHPDDLTRLRPEVERLRSTSGAELTVEARARHTDGTWVDLEVTAVNKLDDPEVGQIVVTSHNITEQKRAERLVASQAEILELLARGAVRDDVLDAVAAMVEDHDEGARAAVVLLEGDRLRPLARSERGPGPEVRAALRRVSLGPEAQAALQGRHGEPVVVNQARTDPRTRALGRELTIEGFDSLWWASATPRGTTEARGGIIAFHPGDHSPSAHARRAADAACTLVAITLERHSTAAALAHQEAHDRLTGLPNRTLLIDRLEIGLERARRMGEEIVLLYVDLDRFKRINDAEGLTAGDQVLTVVAQHLMEVTRPGDTVARVGADEFVVLCDQPGSLSTALAVADHLTERLHEPITIGADELFVTASIGLAMSTAGTDGPQLLRQADAAMDRAKERGRDRLEVYDPAMQASAHDRLTLGSDLRRALALGQLRVVYQPIIDLDLGTMVGAEALLRWRHPTRGEVPPAVFVPVAEETGTINEIGLWVLETALAELGPRVEPGGPFTLSVNLSPRQLDDPTLVSAVQSALRRHDWAADRLCLELTETALNDDLDLALHVLVRLRATGTRIAVDDFGTGYSSLTHLQRLPIDSIKIDRSFVRGLGEVGGSEGSTIARCVLSIAGAMDLDAVAEGVETTGQLDALRRLGCTRGQGYLFSVPVPVEALPVPHWS